MPPKSRLPVVLSIAGSDSGGLAGIQADVKTLTAHRVHPITAVTSVTAQNSRSIAGIHVVPRRMLVAQLESLCADFDIAAVKIGMLGSGANIRAVSQWLREHRIVNVVVDPVLISSSGGRLLSVSAVKWLRDELLPLSSIVTPNVPEAEALLGRRLATAAEVRFAAADLLRLGSHGVLLKGGHFGGRASAVRDYFADAGGTIEIAHPRLPYSARGTGCTLASAIAAGLAKRQPLRRAVQEAEAYLQARYRRARPIGRGNAHALAYD